MIQAKCACGAAVWHDRHVVRPTCSKCRAERVAKILARRSANALPRSPTKQARA